MTVYGSGFSLYSVQKARPTTRYGQPGSVPLRSGSANALFSLPVGSIPKNATIVSAQVIVHTRTKQTGSRTLELRALTSKWNSAVTWNTQPSHQMPAIATRTVNSPAAGYMWKFDIAARLQAQLQGTVVGMGYFLVCPQNIAGFTVYGSSGTAGLPRVLIEYTVPPLQPEALHPSDGAVSDSQPALSFEADEDITGLQVQIDPAQATTNPGWDSGTVVTTGGLLNLADTTYPGLPSDGTPTFWRVRQQTAGGWSPWSEWAGVTLLIQDTLTILSPVGSVADGTPPISWEFQGVQTAWRARLLDSTGQVLSDSGLTPGTDQVWSPPKGLVKEGDQGLVEVTVWDDQDRVAAPGAPDYVSETDTWELHLDAAVAPVDSLEATTDGWAPQVTLTGSRAEIPDELALFRDDTQVGRWLAEEVFTGTSFTVVDDLATTDLEHTWKVVPIVNGRTGSGGPTVTLTPRARGVWLTDLTTRKKLVLFSTEVEQEQPETSIVHQPLNEVAGEGQVVRRRLIRYRTQGTVEGLLFTTPAMTIHEAETTIREWADQDAGTIYQLSFGGFSERVLLGDVLIGEEDNDPSVNDRALRVSLSFYGQA